MNLLDPDINEAFNEPVKRYDQNVDYEFFEAHGVQVIEGKDPWIFFLEHADIEDGRFVWYPTTGSLVREGVRSQGAYTVGKFRTTEEVYNRIINEEYEEQDDMEQNYDPDLFLPKD